MEVEPDTCVLFVKGVNVPGEYYARHVGMFVAEMDYAAGDGYGVMTFAETWRDAQRFESPEAAEAFVTARSPVRPTIDGVEHHPAMTWAYSWSWASDLEKTEARLEVVDAVADAIAHEGSWH